MLKRFAAVVSLALFAFAVGLVISLGPANRAVAETCNSHACCQGPFQTSMHATTPCGGHGHNYWLRYTHWTSTFHNCCLGADTVCSDCNDVVDPGGPDPITPE